MKARFGTATLAIVTVFGVLLFASRQTATQPASCFVTTFDGSVQGVDAGASCVFLGIPFAAPPVGTLRWKPPQPAAPWAPAILNATVASPPCPLVNPPGSTGTVGSENCLKLNIWTPKPAPAKPVPVIVWIHTGAFQAASANLADSNPRNLVERTGAIVVAAHYRLGPFGFMGHASLTAEDPAYRSSGNYGFLDQRAALAWVRDHIQAFGGDPRRVTIAGQSAGGHSVSFHLVSPGSAGYFHRAIVQSGYASWRVPTLADAESLGRDFAARVGCTDPAHVLDCMRAKSQRDVLLAFGNGQQEFVERGRVAWGPVVDGFDIPDQPRILYEHGRFNHVPVILGATRDEGWIYADRSFPAGLTAPQYEAAVEHEFGAADAPAILAMYPAADFATPKHALSQLTGDVEAACEARRVARLISRTRTPVYLYSFEREADAVVPDQVIHGLDRNFVFGNNFGPPSNYVLNADDLSLFGSIADFFTRFAASGDPNGRGRGDDEGEDDDDDASVRWPRFKHSSGRGRGAQKHMVLEVPLRVDKRLREKPCDFWEPFFLGSIVGSVPASQR
jgi:para-nitrobenzyl esterase